MTAGVRASVPRLWPKHDAGASRDDDLFRHYCNVAARALQPDEPCYRFSLCKHEATFRLHLHRCGLTKTHRSITRIAGTKARLQARSLRALSDTEPGSEC